MNNYNISNLKDILNSNSHTLVLYGAGDLGELTKFALENLEIKIDFYCDSNKEKIDKDYFGIKVISPEELFKLDKKIRIYFVPTFFLMEFQMPTNHTC